jgi:Transmembrane domain of unknown function (DUF3566)
MSRDAMEKTTKASAPAVTQSSGEVAEEKTGTAKVRAHKPTSSSGTPSAPGPTPSAGSQPKSAGRKPRGPKSTDVLPPSVPPAASVAGSVPQVPSSATPKVVTGSSESTLEGFAASAPAPAIPPPTSKAAVAAVPAVAEETPVVGGATGATPTTPPRVTSGRASASAAQPAASKAKAATGPRRVRLAVSRIDPWSAMKLSFLLSIAVGIMIVVAAVVFWMVLDGMHVFTEINDIVMDILGENTNADFLQFVEFKRVVSLATIIAVVDVVLLTALSTIGAFLYNVVAALVGGVHLTLIDE